jgi:MGT family glycosyltransferase
VKHFGIISPPVSGHIHPMSALGRELVARGHRVTYLQMLDLEEKIRSEELDFEPIGESDHPRGSLPVSLKQLGQLHGFAALRFTIDAVARTSVMICRDAPDAIRRRGIDALLVDQMEPAGGAVAEHLGIPFVTICNALAMNQEASVPPPFTPWRYRDTAWGRARNRAGYAISNAVTRPISRVVAEFRHRWRLPTLRRPDDSFSKLAQICQMPREFDFPRRELPETFHYVGPLRRPQANGVPFPWERLDGRPVIYASLGTLQNNREPVFRCFAEACRRLDAQLVISHGGGLSDQQAASLPGSPLVVRYAPQPELLKRARVTITHAGLNTVLDSLSAGVAMVLIPLTYEQPAIAQRVERLQAGMVVPFSTLSPFAIENAVTGIFDGQRTADHVQSNAGGVRSAADIVESVLGIQFLASAMRRRPPPDGSYR